MHPLFEQLKVKLGYYEVPPERKADLQNILAEIVKRTATFLGEPVWSEYQGAGELTDYGRELFGSTDAIVELYDYEYMIFRRRKGEVNSALAKR